MSNNGISIARNIQKNNKKNNAQLSKKSNNKSINTNKVVAKEQRNKKQVVKNINNTNKAKIQQNKSKKLAKIRITPLGGGEEVAKNMYLGTRFMFLMQG